MSAVHSFSLLYFISFFKEKAGVDLLNWFHGPHLSNLKAPYWQFWWASQSKCSLILLEDNNTHKKAFKPSSLYPEQKTWAWEQFMWKRVQFSLRSICENTTMWGQKAHCPAPSGILHSLLGAVFNRHQQPETCSQKRVKVKKHLKLLGTRNV